MKRNLITEMGFVFWVCIISYATAVISNIWGAHFGGFMGTGMMGIITVLMVGYYTKIPRVK